LPVGIDHNRRAAHACRVNPGHKCLALGRANPDRLRFSVSAFVAEVDVIVAARQGEPGLVPDGNVFIASAEWQRTLADSCIPNPTYVEGERAGAGCSVLAARRVAVERDGADGRVVTGAVAVERTIAAGSVETAGSVAEESLVAAAGVVAAAVVA